MPRAAWLLALLALPRVALAAELTVVVVPIIVGDAPGVRASELEAAVGEAARQRAGLRVMSNEEAFVGGAKLEELETCGVDPSCIGRALDGSRASMAMIVLANTLGDPPLLAVRLFDVGSRRFVASAAGPLSRAERDLAAAVGVRASTAFEQLGHPLQARVRVEVTPPDATLVVLGGALDPSQSSTYLVPEGPCTVRAEREGYRSAEAQISARAGVTVGVSLVLEPERGDPLLGSPWFWAISIGAVALAGALIYAGVSSSRCVCIAGQPCDC